MRSEKRNKEELERNINRKKNLIRQIRKDLAVKTMLTVGIFAFAFTFVFGVCFAPTNDMFPAVHKGDLIIYYRLGGFINSDIVIYETDDGICKGRNIGRIAATESDVVDRTDGGLLKINGNIQPVQKRAGLFYRTFVREGGGLRYPSEVPPGAYLVLGDEREDAEDSRDHGYIHKDRIKGKVFTVIRRRPV